MYTIVFMILFSHISSNIHVDLSKVGKIGHDLYFIIYLDFELCLV